MAVAMAWIGVRRLIERQMSKQKRTPLEYAILATLGFLAAATLKYPNRAFLTSARKRVGYQIPGFALVGNLPQLMVYRDDPLPILQSTLEEHGDVVYVDLLVFFLYFSNPHASVAQFLIVHTLDPGLQVPYSPCVRSRYHNQQSRAHGAHLQK